MREPTYREKETLTICHLSFFKEADILECLPVCDWAPLT